MNASEKPRRFGIPVFSSEALIGIGITVAELGLLCLLLGWAEYMRSVPKIALIWFALGLPLLILGALAAVSAKSRGNRPVRDRVLPSDSPQAEAQSEPEPEEEARF